MEFADTPIIALRHGARNDREHAAVELLDWEGAWLRREAIARHVTVTMPGDGHYDDDSATAVIDWDNVIKALVTMCESETTRGRGDLASLTVACSLARGHAIDLGMVADAMRDRPFVAARVVSAILYAAGHLDHVVRWPKKPLLPCYVRIVDSLGKVIQEPGQVTGDDEWHETGPRHLIIGEDR